MTERLHRTRHLTPNRIVALVADTAHLRAMASLSRPFHSVVHRRLTLTVRQASFILDSLVYARPRSHAGRYMKRQGRKPWARVAGRSLLCFPEHCLKAT